MCVCFSSPPFSAAHRATLCSARTAGHGQDGGAGRAAGATARGLQIVQQTAANLCFRPARVVTLYALHQPVKGGGICQKCAALTRQARQGALTPADVAQALAQFRYDFDHQYQRVELTLPRIAQAMDLAETHGLRGYDAVQCPCAVALHQS